MDIVVIRIDKSVTDMPTLVLLSMRRKMSSLALLALGVVRNMWEGAWPVEMVSMGVVRLVVIP